jgi:hypothetical protein
MKYLLLSVFLIAGCSTFNPWVPKRHFASISSATTELKLSQEKIFANGVNWVYLTILPIGSNAEEIKIENDQEAMIGKLKMVDGSYQVKIKPKLKSPPIYISVTWKEGQSASVELWTTTSPIKEKLTPIKQGPSNSSYEGGLWYNRQDNFPEGQFESFTISNNGGNVITPTPESQRSFEFSFEEHASQNISLMVNDSPNSTISHTMHSHFMLFPRKYLPFAKVEQEETTVTLPTGEKMIFSKTGEIIGGVFGEGPVDISADRFKRHFPNLKYQGKGVILRANARGQMPQQGQFESTKIDLEYGIKYSADVLIINGTTGQRCRRPKVDFWPAGDINPVPFKFPTDKEFDDYLKANCQFGLPEFGDSGMR